MFYHFFHQKLKHVKSFCLNACLKLIMNPIASSFCQK
uniref:Uncharacterized protein n=1 Tax=Rhizophora mucronata TaxID=61149 RepID=A0A2P2P045_RHIMU